MPIVLAEAQHARGPHSFNEITIPSGATRVAVKAHRGLADTSELDSWANEGNDTLTLVVEFSPNGGRTWQPLGGFKAAGGRLENTNLRQRTDPKFLKWSATTSTVYIWLPDPRLINRKLRGRIVCKARLKTRVEFEFLTTPQIIQPPIHHSVAYITGASSSGFNLTTLTISGTSFTDTSDTLVFVGCGGSAASGGDNTTGVTYDPAGGADAYTEKFDFNKANFWNNSGHLLLAPSTGTKTTDVTWASNRQECLGGTQFFTGVDQTTPAGTPVQATGNTTTATINVTGTTTGNLVVDSFYGQFTTASVAASQIERWNVDNVGGNSGGGATLAGTGGTVTMSWQRDSGAATDWLIGAMELLAAAGGASSILPQMMHHHGA